MTSGPLLFARYAYPPNSLGYCGPDDSAALLQHVAAGQGGAGLVALARQFAGAWPYLQLIAATAGRRDPLDRAVVEAYWVGNRLLDRVPGGLFAAHLADRFEARAGRGMADLGELAVRGAPPHHNFHVFAVYPWIGLLRAGRVAEPLRVLDSCRIRWGRVVALDGAFAQVRSRPLAWDGSRLCLGPPRVERVRALAPVVRPGDLVSVHWDWVCDVLGAGQATALHRYTGRVLDLTNHALDHPVAAAALY